MLAQVPGVRHLSFGDGEDPEHYRDTGVRLEGPVVHALQSVSFDSKFCATKARPAACPPGRGCR